MNWLIVVGVALLLPLFAHIENISSGLSGWSDPEVYLSAIAAVSGVLLIVSSGGSWLHRVFARFRIRFLPPCDSSVQAENRGEATVLAIPAGESRIYFVVMPRIGITLESLNISFFNNRAWPLRLVPWLKPNYRHDLASIKATNLGVMGIKRDWTDYPGEIRNEEATDFIFKPPLEFYARKRKTFRVSFLAANCMHDWEGILGIQLNYKHSGNGVSYDGGAKVFVRKNQSRRPITFVLRHLLWACPGAIQPSASER